MINSESPKKDSLDRKKKALSLKKMFKDQRNIHLFQEKLSEVFKSLEKLVK